ncbi:MAG: single-stranded-DNA-specific exonuclease RecJ [Candidatus Hydrogenedentes bacterium]|nr:single-stranded-DNA-specific exonuclease RecJ [Candidatus Hydrogenedentota bacterium]
MSFAAATYRWILPSFDHEQAEALSQELGIPPIIVHLLAQRNLRSASAIKDFLNPSLAQLTNPFDLTGMHEAVNRILVARKRQESVLIFGDYDVDGISASVILERGLRRFGLNRIHCDMPDRFAEGYGLSPEHVRAAKDQDVNLIITVDNGISAHEAAQCASDLGLDLIVTDHHSLEKELPAAVAVINPKQDDPTHPAHMLAGAGVALKVATALNGTPHDLDIAALGTVSDIVPLLAENRVIVALGIRHMIKHQRIGLKSLAKAGHFNIAEVSSQKISFQLGPRLNAAGRLETGHKAWQLLMTEREDEADALAEELDETNEKRRGIEQRIFEEAEEILAAFWNDEQRSIVLAEKNWHQGVIGIVASRMQARYFLPVIICCLGDDGLFHGSARGNVGFNMVEALEACSEHLITFGGHVAAAGLTLAPEAIDAFRDAFEKEARRQLGSKKTEPILNVHACIALSQIDRDFMRQIHKLEPFGQSNPEPLFCTVGVSVVPQSMHLLNEQHLKFMVRQGDTVFTALAFGMAERFYTEEFPEKLDIVFSPFVNTFRGETSIQLTIKDMCAAR